MQNRIRNNPNKLCKFILVYSFTRKPTSQFDSFKMTGFENGCSRLFFHFQGLYFIWHTIKGVLMFKTNIIKKIKTFKMSSIFQKYFVFL